MNHVLKNRVRHRVLVTTKSNHAFRGVLVDQDKQALVLQSTEMADPQSDAQWIPADGSLVVLLADVAYLQFV